MGEIEQAYKKLTHIDFEELPDSEPVYFHSLKYMDDEEDILPGCNED